MSFGIKFCGFNNYLYGLYKMSPEDFKNRGSRLALSFNNHRATKVSYFTFPSLNFLNF